MDFNSPELTNLILLLQFSATWALVGLVWFVQVVHYPLFLLVGSAEFKGYHLNHTRLTQWVVGPLMLVELLTAVTLLFFRPAPIPRSGLVVGILLLAVIWASTALVQVPIHNRLANGFELPACRKLVATNWLRTITWSLRGLLTGWMVWRANR